MRTIDRVRRSGIGIGPERTVREAAAIMDSAGIGALIVLDGDRPVGIVTDRDLVRRALARGYPPDSRVDAVMTVPVFTIDADADVHEAYRLFRAHGIRRLAVVREGGAFMGMISVDDLLIDLAGDLADLAGPIIAETAAAHRDSPVPATA